LRVKNYSYTLLKRDALWFLTPCNKKQVVIKLWAKLNLKQAVITGHIAEADITQATTGPNLTNDGLAGAKEPS